MVDEESKQALMSTIRKIDENLRSKGEGNLDEQLLNRGLCYQKLGLPLKALKSYDQALTANPLNVAALYRRGQVLAALGRTEEATSCWKDAIAASTATTDIQMVLNITSCIKNPTKVARELRPKQSFPSSPALNQLSTPVFWVVYAVVVACSAYVITNSSFKEAMTIASIGHEGGLRRRASTLPLWGGSAGTIPHSPLQAKKDRTRDKARDKARDRTTDIRKVHEKGSKGSLQQQNHPPPSATRAINPQASAQPPPPDQHQMPGQNQVPDQQQQTPEPPRRTEAAESATSGKQKRTIDPTLTVIPPKVIKQGDSSKGVGSEGEKEGVNGKPSLDARLAVGLAISLINSGKLEQAIGMMDDVVAQDGRNMGARLARGTARAISMDLKAAVEDFSVAIEVEPRYADSWKRRGQARSALGEHEGALSDLHKALELTLEIPGANVNGSISEVHVEIGSILHKKRDYWGACEHLQKAIEYEPGSTKAWNVYGMCTTLKGHIHDGIKAYKTATQINDANKEAWLNMGMALKEAGQTEEAERAFAKTFSLDTPEAPSLNAMFTLSQMRQQLGDHTGALQILSHALSFNKPEHRTQLLYMRAVVNHALGRVADATADYKACQSGGGAQGSPGSDDEPSYMALCFYQHEIALYLYHSFDRPVEGFSMDGELQPLFKELWCKRSMPTPELISQYTYQPPLPKSPPRPPSPPNVGDVQALTLYADRLGNLLQNKQQGFLPNVRLQRAAGYAAIEMAQTFRELLESRRSGKPQWVVSEGSTVQAGSSGFHEFGWRDLMDIVVKWRQLAEPNDQVVWVDLLTRREFEQGFGSHTPLFDGQTKTVRYYMNFDKALGLQKKVLLETGHATSFEVARPGMEATQHPIPCSSAKAREAIERATTAKDMYEVLKEDSWVMLPIKSYYRPHHMMEGTRFVLSKVADQRDGYKFSIRTPVTPPRWKDFDAELALAWEGVVTAVLEGDPQQILRSALAFGYFWYNFMPIVRGTAACGYTTILSILWAAGVPVTAQIPTRYQVDWEAILSQEPDTFISSVGSWILEPEADTIPTEAFPDVQTLPRLRDVLTTARERIEALNAVNPDNLRQSLFE